MIFLPLVKKPTEGSLIYVEVWTLQNSVETLELSRALHRFIGTFGINAKEHV